MIPMRMEWVEFDQAGPYVVDPAYINQQKFDGVHVVVEIRKGRKPRYLHGGGGPLSHAASLLVLGDFARQIDRLQYFVDGDVDLDCELVPSLRELHVFDLPYLRYGDEMLPGVTNDDPLSVRLSHLLKLALVLGDGPVSVAEFAATEDDKLALMRSVLEAGAEGVVFKRLDAPYEQDTRVSHQLKCKVFKTADVVVLELGRNGADNAILGLYDADNQMVEVGACSMIGKQRDRKVHVGDVVEVRYLYATPPAMRLYGPPNFMRVRDDKMAQDCMVNQLVPVNREAVRI